MGTGIKEEPTPEPVEPEDMQEIISEEQEAADISGLSEEYRKNAEQTMEQTYLYIIYILGGLIGVVFLIAIVSAVTRKKSKKKKRKKKK